jgi:hypothetical protein
MHVAAYITSAKFHQMTLSWVNQEAMTFSFAASFPVLESESVAVDLFRQRERFSLHSMTELP